ncbi:hypothetical protein M405DRAFT_825000 [Rhizopogon salebrosus TDB-379]|nr:hypothetical protein M405DRAFT_825000 [Rhizopogon salebrosus TDB-379]
MGMGIIRRAEPVLLVIGSLSDDKLIQLTSATYDGSPRNDWWFNIDDRIHTLVTAA